MGDACPYSYRISPAAGPCMLSILAFKAQNKTSNVKTKLRFTKPRFLMALGAAFADVVLREQGLRVSTGGRDPIW